MLEVLIIFIIFFEMALCGFLIFWILKTDKKVLEFNEKTTKYKNKIVRYFDIAKYFLHKANKKILKLKRDEEKRKYENITTIINTAIFAFFLFRKIKEINMSKKLRTQLTAK